jgi:hypothetical protein
VGGGGRKGGRKGEMVAHTFDSGKVDGGLACAP